MQSKFSQTTKVLRVTYDFKSRLGNLFMAPGCCCDMDECVTFFKTIDDRVLIIQTLAGDVPDTFYAAVTDGSWRAVAGPWQAVVEALKAKRRPKHYPKPEAIVEDLLKRA